MSEIAIDVSGLGKKYIIGHQKSGDFREAFGHKLKNLFSRTNSEQEEFWALKNLNFQIKKGEAVGIVGRNGAGKSTLLKILSRIAEPSTGRFEINGRVSSLLEVGTGFHPELTGRENIFLNGTILGMRRAEVKAKFDEIVDFSGVEKFLDTPVKHYSSGMKVRLAFSVAAHLEPEILIVDEVLAVGDAEFQKKCLGKMDEVSKNEGRTVLFVSHNLAAIEHLCTNGILLGEGLVMEQGEINKVIETYLKVDDSKNLSLDKPIPLGSGVVVKRFLITKDVVHSMDDIKYEITISSPSPNRFNDLAILVYNHLQERLGILDLRHSDLWNISATQNEFTIAGSINKLPLIEGTYQLGLFVSSSLCHGDFLNLRRLSVNSGKQEFTPYSLKHRGYLEFNHNFSMQ